MDEISPRNFTARRARDLGQGVPRRLRRTARSVAAVTLIVLGVLCLSAMPVAVWGRNLVLDTDRYVETLTPLARDTGVQDAVIAAVEQQVSANLDVRALAADVLPPRAAAVLGGALAGAVDQLVHDVTTDFVRSPAFETTWVRVNRLAHEQVRYVLIGKAPTSSAVRIDKQGKLLLDLSEIVQSVKDRLVAAGITVADRVPTTGAVLEIADVHGLIKARRATSALNAVADWLPWVGLALVGAGIATARTRRRALMWSALGVGAGMIVLGIGLLVARGVYLDAVPENLLPRDTAAFIFDTLVRFLRLGIRLLLLVSLLVALGAWVSGPSAPATGLRRALTALPQAVGRRFETGPAGRFVVRYLTALRTCVVLLAGTLLVLTNAPSIGTLVALAIGTVVVLLILELLRATARSGSLTPARDAEDQLSHRPV